MSPTLKRPSPRASSPAISAAAGRGRAGGVCEAGAAAGEFAFGVAGAGRTNGAGSGGETVWAGAVAAADGPRADHARGGGVPWFELLAVYLPAALHEELGRAPTEEEIAHRLKLTPRKLRLVKKAIRIKVDGFDFHGDYDDHHTPTRRAAPMKRETSRAFVQQSF